MAGAQVPVPVQVRGVVKVVPEQEAAVQTVPLTYCRQAPLPSQVPSVPQPAAPSSVHWLAGVGASPAGKLAQVPAVP